LVVTSLFRSIALLVLLGFVTPAPNAQEPSSDTSGVLIGLRRQLDEDNPRYTTLWVRFGSNGAQIDEVPDILLVPQADGSFRTVGVTVVNEGTVSEQMIWSVPLGQTWTPRRIDPQQVEGCSHGDLSYLSLMREIIFANQDYLGIRESEESSCGPHPEGSSELSMVPLAQPDGRKLPFASLWGPAAQGAVSARIAKLLKDARADGCDQPSSESWSVRHDKGGHAQPAAVAPITDGELIRMQLPLQPIQPTPDNLKQWQAEPGWSFGPFDESRFGFRSIRLTLERTPFGWLPKFEIAVDYRPPRAKILDPFWGGSQLNVYTVNSRCAPVGPPRGLMRGGLVVGKPLATGTKPLT
jgi:hypothetical protein